ncbi:hypothetical protein EV363DRAFT_254890 [Boletus edulis]|nr:hypothetical protein EV363DRAFT_254890 [Boletus edulis]
MFRRLVTGTPVQWCPFHPGRECPIPHFARRAGPQLGGRVEGIVPQWRRIGSASRVTVATLGIQAWWGVTRSFFTRHQSVSQRNLITPRPRDPEQSCLLFALAIPLLNVSPIARRRPKIRTSPAPSNRHPWQSFRRRCAPSLSLSTKPKPVLTRLQRPLCLSQIPGSSRSANNGSPSLPRSVCIGRS